MRDVCMWDRMMMMTTNFWILALCRLVGSCQGFEGTNCLLLQGGENHSTSIFNEEAGDGMFVRNVYVY
jgi:hypothetical protein